MPPGWRDGEMVPLLLIFGVMAVLGGIVWLFLKLDRRGRIIPVLLTIVAAAFVAASGYSGIKNGSYKSLAGVFVGIFALAFLVPMWLHPRTESRPRRRRGPLVRQPTEHPPD